MVATCGSHLRKPMCLKVWRRGRDSNPQYNSRRLATTENTGKSSWVRKVFGL